MYCVPPLRPKPTLLWSYAPPVETYLRGEHPLADSVASLPRGCDPDEAIQHNRIASVQIEGDSIK